MFKEIPESGPTAEGVEDKEAAKKFQETALENAAVDHSDLHAAAQENQAASRGQADRLVEEIKKGSRGGKLRRLIESFVLGATLIAGNPAHADVVPDAPKPEAMKKETGEMEKIRAGRVSDPKYGDFVIEAFYNKSAAIGAPYSVTYEIRVNGEPRKVISGMRLRNGATNFEIEGKKPGMNEHVHFPPAYGKGSGGTGIYTITDPESGQPVELDIQ